MAAHQAPLSLGFSRQEWWSGLPFPSPGDLPDPGIKPESPALQAESTELEEEPPKSKEDLSFLKQTKACLRQVWDLGPLLQSLHLDTTLLELQNTKKLLLLLLSCFSRV